MTLSYPVPARTGDVILFIDGNQALVTDSLPKDLLLRIAPYGSAPLVGDPAAGDKQFWIFPDKEKADQMVDTWIHSTVTGIRGKTLVEIHQSYRYLYQEIVAADTYFRNHGLTGNLAPQPQLTTADIVVDNDPATLAPAAILAPVRGGRLPSLVPQVINKFEASHSHYIRFDCSTAIVTWLKMFETAGVLSGAYLTFEGEVLAANGAPQFVENKRFPLCATVDDSSCLCRGCPGSAYRTAGGSAWHCRDVYSRFVWKLYLQDPF